MANNLTAMKRFFIAFSTSRVEECFKDGFVNHLKHHASQKADWAWGLLERRNPSWISDKDALYKWSELNFTPRKESLSYDIHGLLDQLPDHLGFLLDCIVLHDQSQFSDLPVPIYGVLKRAVEWHGAKVTIVTSKSDYAPSEMMEDLSAEIISFESLDKGACMVKESLIWRGCLSLLDPHFKEHRLHGFELNAKCGALQIIFPNPRRNIDLSNKRLAKRLKIIGAFPLTAMSKHLWTDIVMDLVVSDELGETFLGLTEVNSNSRVLISRLFYCDKSSPTYNLKEKSKPKRRKTQDWNKAVSKGDVELELDDIMEKASDSIYLALLPSTKTHDGKLSLKVVILNVPLIQDDFEETTSKNVRPKMEIDEPLRDELLRELLPDHDFNLEQRVMLQASLTEDTQWDERRLLNFLDHCDKQKRNQTSGCESMMTPSGEYLILEPKEIVKFFTNKGSPSYNNLEEIYPKRSKTISQDADENSLRKRESQWQNSLLVDFHGLHYNRSEESEDQDKELLRIQRLFVGSKETASSCNVIDAKPDIIPMQGRNAKGRKKSDDAIYVKSKEIKEPLKRAPLVSALRRSDSRSSMTSSSSKVSRTAMTKEDILIRKIRCAVYEILEENNVKEGHSLFRPCFKRLFDICKMCAKSIPANAGSTSQWLKKIAKNNVETVIDLEKTLRCDNS